MCGIVGYLGDKSAGPVLVAGLARLEYRGYDSAGVATVSDGQLHLRRRVGKLRVLEASLHEEPVPGQIGIGHTRWATHGEPTEANAHPHRDCHDNLAVVHNGIIENFEVLRARLETEGHTFRSRCDSEVIAHLIEHHLTATPNGSDPLAAAVRATARELRGSFALVVVDRRHPDQLIAARRHSPLLIGLGENENYVASDMSAVLHATRRTLLLEDDEVAVILRDSVRVTDLDGNPRAKSETRIEWEAAQAERGGYPHFMLKEIHEQPAVVRRLLARYAPEGRRVQFDQLGLNNRDLREVRHLIIAACGTSWHAGLIGRLLLERLARVSVATEVASEFRYRYEDFYSERDHDAIADELLRRDTLVVALSQSGETADTLAGVRQAREFGLKVVSLVNVPGSTLARESDGVIDLSAGPEIGVASTKAYTAQLAVLYLLALHLAEQRGFADPDRIARRLQRMAAVADEMERALESPETSAHLHEVAAQFAMIEHFLFIGRGFGYPTALEGALKLKEISYAHAEGYPAGELKHGPIALVDESVGVVAVAPNGATFEKMVSNLQEVRARRGRVIAVGTQGSRALDAHAEAVLPVPDVTDSFAPFVTILPLQMLAYHIALIRGCDVDQPRNLAKSVTVE